MGSWGSCTSCRKPPPAPDIVRDDLLRCFVHTHIRFAMEVFTQLRLLRDRDIDRSQRGSARYSPLHPPYPCPARAPAFDVEEAVDNFCHVNFEEDS
jgi:hypothetical protein